ncbi:MAG: cupredoxin family copper-binding protein [Rhodoplanes sp.]|uniref:cupredoxin domain-containing protein n=1 Tax=Rhodoplanes sp. TaxID=1968906 RepID=UPI0017EF4A4D|nr:cupredoxin family copper-binding protein [Rhodoplanes sp.]NVO15574.1 cupredoxin family copper-binding protein [Rhodoplanes sp.]
MTSRTEVSKSVLRRFGVAVLLGLALAAPAARGETSAPAAAKVSIDNFTFSPDRLTVAPGTTVTWTNADDIPHTVVATGKAFRSKALDTDDSFAFTFTTPGTFDYFCSLHPHMHATIVVEAGRS